MISKNLGPFTVSLSAEDLFNQQRNLVHTVTANYIEDTYHMVQGRFILLGLRWNFGKMNAANSRRASNAAWQLSAE